MLSSRRARLAGAALLASVAALIAAAEPAAPEVRPRLAVLDLGTAGASPSLAAAAGGVVASELDRLAVFKVVTAEAIRALLAHELQRQLPGGCTGGDCVTAVGGALGADYLVAGKVSAVGGAGAPQSFTIDLTLSAVRTGTQEGQATETASSESELMLRLPRAVGRLTARVLASRSGRLLVTAWSAGARPGPSTCTSRRRASPTRWTSPAARTST